MLKSKEKIISITLIIVLLISSCSDTAIKANIKFACPKIETTTADLTSTETLVLDGSNGTYLMDMSIMIMTLIDNTKENFESFAVSPNRRWIAYNATELDKNLAYIKNNLVIAGADNHVYKILPWESEWGTILWLNNQQLIIRLIQQAKSNLLDSSIPNFLILNPITGERQNLKADYQLPTYDGWDVTAYDPTLTRLVFLKGDVSGPFYYVLWDIQHKRQITNFQIADDLNTILRWSPDGKQFAFAPSLFSKIKEYPSYELYSVTKDGKIKQLTHLTDYYPWDYISDLSWSPDSRYIAFWFSHWQKNENPSYDSVSDRDLAVLDTTTNLVTSYCINGEKNATIGIRIYQPPVWSPDSKQIVIESQTGDDTFQTILIDVQKNRAFHLADDLEPVGWMVSP